MSRKPQPPNPTAVAPSATSAAFDAAVAAEVARQLAARSMAADPSTLPPDLQRDRLIGAEPAAAMLGYSLAHFRRLYRSGKIPAPVKINGRKVGWRAGGLRDFIASREAVA